MTPGLEPWPAALERRRGARAAGMGFSTDRRRLRVGLVNNMPDAALAATERQFRALVEAAAPDRRVEIVRFHLPELPRSAEAAARLAVRSHPVGVIGDAGLDALIVTGAEPLARDLRAEPFWDSFARLADWAEAAAMPTLWSCLAAHAAVLHRDGVQRHPLMAKCSGLYACEPVGRDPLLRGLDASWITPHSRNNGLDEAELTAAGYRVLSRSAEAGVDAFSRRTGRGVSLFLQGHPEYDAASLALEFKRDLHRYLRGERETAPLLPQGAFGAATTVRLQALADTARRERRAELIADWPAGAELELAENTWRAPAVTLYRNWLAASYGEAEAELAEPARIIA